MPGEHGRIRRFAVGPVYPNKSLTMCSSDFVFRKYKQDSALRVSGVLQLAKTGPPVTKNFPLRHLIPSDAMIAWRFYTPYDVKCTNLHILTAHAEKENISKIPSATEKLSSRDSADHPKDIADSFSHALATYRDNDVNGHCHATTFSRFNFHSQMVTSGYFLFLRIFHLAFSFNSTSFYLWWSLNA